MLVLRNSRLFFHLPSLTQTAWMLPAAPRVDGQEVWQCQTEMDVGAVVALDAVTFGSALPHSYN